MYLLGSKCHFLQCMNIDPVSLGQIINILCQIFQYNIPHEVQDVTAGGREMLRCFEDINPFRVLPTIVDCDTVVFGK